METFFLATCASLFLPITNSESQGLLGSMFVQFLVHTNAFFHSLFFDPQLSVKIVLIQYQMVSFVDIT